MEIFGFRSEGTDHAPRAKGVFSRPAVQRMRRRVCMRKRMPTPMRMRMCVCARVCACVGMYESAFLLTCMYLRVCM